MKEGYQEEALDRNIRYSRWKKMKRLKDVTITKGWANENNFEGWSFNTQKMLVDYTLDELKYDNVDFIRIRIPFFMKDSTDTEILEIFEGRMDISLRPFELKYIINQAHNKGLGISIVPVYDDINSFPFGYLAPISWEEWFQNYGTYLLKIASIAEETGVDILHVGEGFINVSGTISDERWGTLFRAQIQKSRLIYPGPEAYLDHNYYSWMFGQWDKIKIWKDVDIVGGGPLWGQNDEITTSLDPSFNEIYNYFKNHINTHIQNLYNLTKRPIIYFENGIVSGDGVFKNFMDYIVGKSFSVDMTEQELYYKALFEVMKDLDKDWFFGQGWYGFSFLPATGGVNDPYLTPRGKPAEDVMRFYYGNGDTKQRIIRIDGKFDDWKPEFLLVTDSLGDSKTTAYDLKAV